MIVAALCLVLAASVSGQRPFTGSSRLRVSDTEKHFYNAFDNRPEDGWSDDRSIGVQHAYGVVLIPAKNLAQLNFSALNSVWRLEARDQGYLAKEEDEIVFRIRGEGPETPLTFFAGPGEDVEPVRQRIVLKPEWHKITVPLKGLASPSQLRLVGFRSDAQGPATVYLGYIYLHVNPATPPKPRKI